MLSWYRWNFRDHTEGPTMLFPPAFNASSTIVTGHAKPNASTFLHFCSVYEPPSKLVGDARLSQVNDVADGSTWPKERSWRACLFGAISDLSRERTAGIALLSRQAVDDKIVGSKGQWRVLKAACDGFFPIEDSAMRTSYSFSNADHGWDRHLGALARRLCLDALLSHAVFDRYSPCGDQILATTA
eukprot:scaffold293245_cov35-Tisochrysis_lutea.AAC.1